jgi:hypothetical protein
MSVGASVAPREDVGRVVMANFASRVFHNWYFWSGVVAERYDLNTCSVSCLQNESTVLRIRRILDWDWLLYWLSILFVIFLKM